MTSWGVAISAVINPTKGRQRLNAGGPCGYDCVSAQMAAVPRSGMAVLEDEPGIVHLAASLLRLDQTAKIVALALIDAGWTGGATTEDPHPGQRHNREETPAPPDAVQKVGPEQEGQLVLVSGSR